MSKTIYPDSIELILSDLNNSLTNTGFFTDYPEVTDSEIREVFGPYLFDKWISSGEPEITEQELETFEAMLSRVVANSTLNTLKEKGLIDWIDDGEGNEMVFLTDAGKSVAELNFVNPSLN